MFDQVGAGAGAGAGAELESSIGSGSGAGIKWLRSKVFSKCAAGRLKARSTQLEASSTQWWIFK